MADSSLKKKVFSGMIWMLFERIGGQLIALIIQIILARLLMPEEFGVIAIVVVFIALSNVITTSGLSMSLVQKKDADNIDFSTSFYMNIAFGILLYGILFFCAPLIADFYDMPILTPLLQVMGLSIPVSAANSVQRAFVSREMIFKRFFVSTLIGNSTAGILGIIAALSGWGVWALAVQQICSPVFDTLILWFTVKWRPQLVFSFERFKGLFSFGWKVLASNLIYEFCKQLRSLLVGKFYTTEELAYFNRGEQIPLLISTNADNVLQSALFPAMSKEQDDRERVKAMLRRTIKTGCFVIFPLMIGLAAVAEPLVSLLLTDKWLPCVPFLQVFCAAYALQTIQSSNLQAIRAIGHSDIALIQDIIKRVIDIALLLAAIQFGVFALALSCLISSVIAAIVNAVPSARLFKYSLGRQVLDILPALAISLVMGAAVYALSFLPLADLPLLICQLIVGAALYVGLAKLFKFESLNFMIDLLKSYKKKGGEDGKDSETATEETEDSEGKDSKDATEETEDSEGKDSKTATEETENKRDKDGKENA